MELNGYVVVILVVWVIAVAAIFILARNVTKDVETALKDATTEEQEIIRNKLVKAIFPPRFPRD